MSTIKKEIMKEETLQKLNWEKPELVDLDIQDTHGGPIPFYLENITFHAGATPPPS